MPAELTAQDVAESAEGLAEVLESPGARVVDEHGHEIALDGPLAAFFREAVLAARQGRVSLFCDDITLSPAEAAERLGVSRPMIYRYIADGLLEDQPVGSYHRIPAASVRELADRRRGAASRAAQLLRDEPDHPRVAAARERVRARRARIVDESLRN